MAKVKAIPEGYTTVTPSLVLRDSGKAIEFYKKAFDAKERMRMMAEGKVMHAEIQVGNSIVMMNDEVMGSRSAEALGGCPVSFYLYVEDVDAAHRKAIAAGGQETYAPTDMFWGDRMSNFKDPFGYSWSLASHVKDVTPEEMKKGQQEFMKQMAGAR